MKRLLSFALAFLLMLGLGSPALAAKAKAVTMRVELVEGSVTIRDAGGVALELEFAVERLGIGREAERGEPRGGGAAQRAVAEDAAAGREMGEKELFGFAPRDRRRRDENRFPERRGTRDE